MAQTLSTPAPTEPAPPARPRRPDGTTKPGVILAKVLGLGLVLALAAALTPTLVAGSRWGFLAVVWVVAGLAVLSYAGRGLLPAKYLLPGSIGLFMFLVFLAVLAWALRPGASFRDQAEIPFKHDDNEDQRHG